MMLSIERRLKRANWWRLGGQGLAMAICLAGGTAVLAEPISQQARQQISALQAEKATRTPAQRKMDSQLVYGVKMSRGESLAAGVPTLRLPFKADPNGLVEVDIKATVTPELLSYIGQTGGNVINSSVVFQAVRAAVPLKAMEALAARADVRFIGLGLKPHLNTGSVTSEGDVTHTANQARSIYGIDGAGVKIGVLSDSVDHLAASQATGDLPNVTVLTGQSGVPGTGEGTAMLEIIADLAPGAELFFATADGGQANFAQNILALRAAGCDIIVDDVYYGTEPPFQDGIVGQAVNAVTADGALYFSSAGNAGNKSHGTSGTWEGDFVDGGPAGTPVDTKGGNIHLFGTNTYNRVTGYGYLLTLYWADPLGASTNDYDLYLLDTNGTAVVASSTTTQKGSEDPLEIILLPNLDERVVVVKAAGDPRFLHLNLLMGRLQDNTTGWASGHAMASGAFSVAAVYEGTSYPRAFSGGSQNPVEDFSSDGPRRVFFHTDGTPITPGDFLSTGGTVRQYPTIAAADGVTTSVPGFAPFYGTSAAAPHAGAVAALLKSYNSDLTTSQVRSILTSSALDIEASGVDVTSGYGIVMALAAIQASPPPTPLPRLVLSTNYVSGGNGNGVVDYNECNNLSLVITNVGRAAASGIRATLSTTTAGVIVAQPVSSYPNLLIGGAATNLTPFKISTAPYFVCGTPIKLTLVVKSDQNSTTNYLTLATGISGKPLRFENYSAMAIPDGGQVDSPVVVSNVDFSLNQISVSLHITHTYDSDLLIQLIAPDGTICNLSANNGSYGQNYGVSCSPDSQRTTFDSAASSSIIAGSAPFVGSFQPQESFSVFAGKSGTNVNGIWRLRVADQALSDTGTLQCWSLFITPTVCVDGGGECPGSDLAIGMTAAPEPVVVNNFLTYSISVTNFGPSSAQNAVVSQLLPSGMTFVSAVSSQGGCSQVGGVVTCNLGVMRAGGTATISVVVVPNQNGEFTSSASVSSEQADYLTANNTATVTSNVRPATADLAVGIVPAPTTVWVGSNLTYTISVTNNGPSTATSVTATNIMPASASIVSAVPSQGTLSISGNTVSCVFGTLTNAGRASVVIVVAPEAEGTIVATSTVQASQYDPAMANNKATVSTVVGAAADLAVSITDYPDPVVLLNTLTYTITVTNRGLSTATSAVLKYSLPASASLVSMSSSQGTLAQSGSTITANLGTILKDGKATITIKITPQNSGPLAGTVSVTAAQPDPDISNNTATATTQVAPPFVSVVAAGATLTAESISPPNGSVDNGETVTVSLRLRNGGNVNNTNLVATLLAGNGVTPAATNNTQTYGVLAPSGFPVARSFTFTASGAPGSTVLAVLQLKDGGVTLTNTVSFAFTLPSSSTFSNVASIEIRDNDKALPFPSTINVSGLTGVVGRVTASLYGFTHTFPKDVNVLLVGPTGLKTLLLSHAGNVETAGLDLTFDDLGASVLPADGQLTAGTWQPTAYSPAPSFVDPAPAGPYPVALSTLNGANPSGTWSLYINDDSAGDAGVVTRGWGLTFTTISPVNQVADLGLAVSAPPASVLLGGSLTYNYVITNGGPNNASFVSFTNTLPVGATFVSATASQGTVNASGGAVVCALGALNAGASATISVKVTPTAVGTYVNSASVSGVETDLNLANNAVITSTSVTQPTAALTLTQAAAPNPVTSGYSVTNTISLTNAGPDAALSAVLTDVLPVGATLISGSASMGTWTNVAGIVTCRFGDLPVNGSASLVLVFSSAELSPMTNVVSVATASANLNSAGSVITNVIGVLPPTPVIAAAGRTLMWESGPVNGAVDSNETVTISFVLTNQGTADTTNLVATLQASGGVTPVDAAQQAYGALVRGGPAVAATFKFTAQGTNGGAITATLRLQDGAADLGAVTYVFNLPSQAHWATASAISIPDHGTGLPYPAGLDVAGLNGSVSKVTVTLYGLSHTFPHDVNVLLVSPTGRNVLLMSHAGGGYSLTNVNLTFDDASTNTLPSNGRLDTGTVRPSSYSAAVTFSPPAPVKPYGTTLANLNGTDPNGRWSLFVLDDSVGDAGAIAGGWSLDITTVETVNLMADLALALSSSPATLYVGGIVTNTVTVTNLGPANATGVVVTHQLPLGSVFVDTIPHGLTTGPVGGVVRCNLGNVVAAGTYTFQLLTAPSVGGTLHNDFSVAGNEYDVNPANNSAETTTVVVSPIPPVLSATVTNGEFHLTITAEPNQTYVIQATPSLLPANWINVSTNTANAGGVIKYSDTSVTSEAARYYRAQRVLP